MKANVGGFDQAVRIMLGLVLVIMAIGGVVGAWGYLGFVLSATGLFGFCGAYKLIGVSTCSTGH
jgi:Protein of unknown function (DUF2892)